VSLRELTEILNFLPNVEDDHVGERSDPELINPSGSRLICPKGLESASAIPFPASISFSSEWILFTVAGFYFLFPSE